MSILSAGDLGPPLTLPPLSVPGDLFMRTSLFWICTILLKLSFKVQSIDLVSDNCIYRWARTMEKTRERLGNGQGYHWHLSQHEAQLISSSSLPWVPGAIHAKIVAQKTNEITFPVGLVSHKKSFRVNVNH
uniref:Uncharacterized protein n=1 Tax=Oryza punctata TaxID=4537 RepID=A0A0E0JZ11_ORYPU